TQKERQGPGRTVSVVILNRFDDASERLPDDLAIRIESAQCRRREIDDPAVAVGYPEPADTFFLECVEQGQPLVDVDRGGSGLVHTKAGTGFRAETPQHSTHGHSNPNLFSRRRETRYSVRHSTGSHLPNR